MAGKTFPASPAHAQQSAILRIWLEAHFQIYKFSFIDHICIAKNNHLIIMPKVRLKTISIALAEGNIKKLFCYIVENVDTSPRLNEMICEYNWQNWANIDLRNIGVLNVLSRRFYAPGLRFNGMKDVTLNAFVVFGESRSRSNVPCTCFIWCTWQVRHTAFVSTQCSLSIISIASNLYAGLLTSVSRAAVDDSDFDANSIIYAMMEKYGNGKYIGTPNTFSWWGN